MNWNKCPCCGYPCEVLFISVDCVNASCQNYSHTSKTKYETLVAQESNTVTLKDDLYDEDYGYPLYGFWNQQDTD